MGRVLAAIALVLSLTGCDAPGIAGGSAELKQAEGARASEERVSQQLDAANQAHDEQRRDAESQGR